MRKLNYVAVIRKNLIDSEIFFFRKKSDRDEFRYTLAPKMYGNKVHLKEFSVISGSVLVEDTTFFCTLTDKKIEVRSAPRTVCMYTLEYLSKKASIVLKDRCQVGDKVYMVSKQTLYCR
jgi:hypothetical protein